MPLNTKSTILICIGNTISPTKVQLFKQLRNIKMLKGVKMKRLSSEMSNFAAYSRETIKNHIIAL